MITPSEAIALQKRLRRSVSRRWDGRPVRLVGAADVHFPGRGRSRAALVIMTFPGLETVESIAADSPTAFPYIPGLLSFREIPPILEAWKRLERIPDLLLCDGHGTAHPRGLGFASHLGLVLDLPTIGCAKSHLFGAFEEPGPERADRSPVRDRSGRTIGSVLRTRAGVRPVFVSTGHRIDLRTAVRFVLACSPRHRIPIPLRLAHQSAGRI
ncbi:MAG: deoxyribonuclease V [Candidatus Krumholzibacteria bacterium]|nr:deoxyribonuclease V [Candidatus Krumholzibacteria bacterium]